MRALLVTLILLAPSGGARIGAADRCLSFEPAVHSIVGTLVRRTFPGPPNYESIEAGDEPETGWYVRLAEPVCFAGTPADLVNGRDLAGVTLVQLVLTADGYKAHAALIGRRVVATGTFFSAHTGHHHTPALLRVGTLQPVRTRRPRRR